MNKILIFIGLILCSLTFGQNAIPEGAYGLGNGVRGAYAGSANPAILYVDTLINADYNSDATHGSLRWALDEAYPRIILFEVSGYINLTTSLVISDDYVSMYGQTAPSPGITISGDYALDFRCNQVLIQHVRFRSSYDGTNQIDALSLLDGVGVFIDHCSFSYSEDELLGVGSVFETNLTVQNCIFYQPLTGSNSKGMLINSNVADSISLIRNAFVHCATRTPLPNGTGYTAFEILNNVSYNPAFWGIDLAAGNAAKMNIIGNEWRAGGNTSGSRQVVRIEDTYALTSEMYLLGNYSPARVSSTSEWDGVVSYEDGVSDSTEFKVSSPFSWGETEYYDYTELNDSLTANAGAIPWDRDSVDIIALDDLANLTGSWITAQSEAYYPTLAENKATPNIPANPNTDAGDGYTNLEIWLSEIGGDVATLEVSLASTNITCNGDADGTITTTVTNGTEPYTYLWNDAITTKNRDNLDAGEYIVVVTDAVDSTATDTVTLTEPTAFSISGSVVNDNGTSNGSITLTVSGATPSYTYLWSPGAETSKDLTGLSYGEYSVIVTDASSCTGYDTSTVYLSASLDTLIWTNTTTTTDWFGIINGAINQVNITIEPDLDTLRTGYDTRGTWILKTNAFIKEFSNDTVLNTDNLDTFVTKTNAAIKQIE